jgi:acylphosphatase
MDDVVRRHVLVAGRVQGVFFRASAQREAARLRLSGMARNLHDGRVEMTVEGPAAAVDAFVAWARIGPPRAQVTTIQIEQQEPQGTRGFRVS